MRSHPLPFLSFAAGLLSFTGCHVAHFRAADTRPAPDLTIRAHLERDVQHLAGTIGERNVYRRPEQLQAAREWIRAELAPVAELAPDVADVPTRPVTVELDAHVRPAKAANVIAELPAAEPVVDEVIVIGAHYDTMTYSRQWEGTKPDYFTPQIRGTPGANDNASGVAALLEIARQLRGRTLHRPVRFIAFVNEEPPFFQHRAAMGSTVYARGVPARDRIAMMISLDALAVYTDDRTDEKRPWWKGWFANLRGLHRRPDYVAFMSNWNAGSGARTVEWARAFSAGAAIDVRTISLPFIADLGTEVFAWSDDWSFTQHGVPAFTVTDTAFLRSDRYHEATDTPDALGRQDYNAFAHVVAGLVHMIETQANSPTSLLPARQP